MTRTYRLTPRAVRDLEDIADYTIATWGPDQMESYVRRLAGRFEWLAEHPMLGRDRDDVRQGYRCFREGEHLIFYLVEAERIAIIGVPHRAMDVDLYFDDSKSGS